MNAHDRDANEVTELLNAYSASPPERFAAVLLDRLSAELPAPARRREATWNPRRVALAASVAAVACAIGAGIYLRNRYPARGPVAHPVARAQPRVAPPAVTIDSPPDAGTSRLSEVAVDEMVGRSLLEVRCRLAKWEAPLATYSIVYIIYGDCPDETITIDFSDSVGDPAEAAAGTVPGRDMVLELRPLPERLKAGAKPGVKYQRLGTYYFADDIEPEILGGITTGSAYDLRAERAKPKIDGTPGKVIAPRIDQQMIDAQLIVRAQLVQAGDAGESTWKVIRVLKGEAKPQTVILTDQLFRQRAKAIVAAAARKQARPPTTRDSSPAATQPARVEVPPALIDAEVRRLTAAELTAGVEAILFVDDVKAEPPNAVRGRLRYRAYEDEQKKKLDVIQDAITRPELLEDDHRL